MTQNHLVNNFIHKIGSHCESSAMRDMFEFYGFPMSEPMAFGLDGTMGFAYFDSSTRTAGSEPSDMAIFVGGKQDTITPNSLACRLLGITLRKQSFTSADKAWEESKKLLMQDVPLLIQVDLGFLPYFEEEEEIHFGGHAITLAGYNEDKGFAYVGDTEFEGFQEIFIEDLKKARNSRHGPKFLHPNNTQYSMQRRVDGKHPPFAAGVKLAIQKVVNHMLRPSMNNVGIQGFKRFANAILNWNETLKGQIINPYNGKEESSARLTFELIHGYIETWGTGGASFRNLYKSFIEELVDHPELKEGQRAWKIDELEILKASLPHLTASAQKWTLLAETLKNAADEYKNECLKHVNLNELHNLTLEILSEEEQLFKKLSKIKI
ncbi:MAG: BtrH N-terminal domain-containing protein [Promethearchaeota archaeon]